jgi:hypothetical protein
VTSSRQGLTACRGQEKRWRLHHRSDITIFFWQAKTHCAASRNDKSVCCTAARRTLPEGSTSSPEEAQQCLNCDQRASRRLLVPSYKNRDRPLLPSTGTLRRRRGAAALGTSWGAFRAEHDEHGATAFLEAFVWRQPGVGSREKGGGQRTRGAKEAA